MGGKFAVLARKYAKDHKDKKEDLVQANQAYANKKKKFLSSMQNMVIDRLRDFDGMRVKLGHLSVKASSARPLLASLYLDGGSLYRSFHIAKFYCEETKWTGRVADEMPEETFWDPEVRVECVPTYHLSWCAHYSDDEEEMAAAADELFDDFAKWIADRYL